MNAGRGLPQGPGQPAVLPEQVRAAVDIQRRAVPFRQFLDGDIFDEETPVPVFERFRFRDHDFAARARWRSRSAFSLMKPPASFWS